MVRKVLFLTFAGCLLAGTFVPALARAATSTSESAPADYSESSRPKVQFYFSARTGSFSEGSTFEVPIFLNSRGQSVNAVELYVNFDPRKLAIVKPTSDKSIISIWLEPPVYSNAKGTVKITGTIPNGTVTSGGIITTITFKAIEPGTAAVSISEASRVLANDGLGSKLLTQFDRATFTIIPQAPQDVRVFSETHPFDDHWYNNASPVLGWDKEDSVTDFSYALTSEPFTIPDNTSKGSTTVIAYENQPDGIWYFHIKARKHGIWGATTHFPLKIDTTPPADFTPTIEVMTAAASDPRLVSFFTTDALSGVDHYEVGIIEKDAPPLSSPIFTQADSPYKLPLTLNSNAKVIIRAFDRAGNVKTASTDVRIRLSILNFITEHNAKILLAIILFIFGLLIFHYVFGHHLIRRLRRTIQFFRRTDDSAPDRAEAESVPVKKLERLPAARRDPLEASVIAEPIKPVEIVVPDIPHPVEPLQPLEIHQDEHTPSSSLGEGS